MSFRLLIVNFHYLRSQKPSSGIYPVSPLEFEHQLETLAKKFEFCSQQDILDWIRGKKTMYGNFCLITFDDALAEQMEAVNILLRKGIPAIFFIPAGPYLTNSVLKVHKLHHIRSVLSDLDLFDILEEESEISAFPFVNEKLAAQYRYDNEIARKIKFFINFALSEEESEQLIGKIFDQLANETEFVDTFYMSRNDLIRISDHNMLGSHGTAHRPLATLPPEEVKTDIRQSLDFLENLTKRKVYSFSYPFGSKSAVDEAVASQFHDTSVELAITMFRGINTASDIKAKYFLKRVDTHDAPGGKNPLAELMV